jgi:hypothetical protein
LPPVSAGQWMWSMGSAWSRAALLWFVPVLLWFRRVAALGCSTDPGERSRKGSAHSTSIIAPGEGVPCAHAIVSATAVRTPCGIVGNGSIRGSTILLMTAPVDIVTIVIVAAGVLTATVVVPTRLVVATGIVASVMVVGTSHECGGQGVVNPGCAAGGRVSGIARITGNDAGTQRYDGCEGADQKSESQNMFLHVGKIARSEPRSQWGPSPARVARWGQRAPIVR